MARLEIVVGGGADPSGRRGRDLRDRALRGELVRLAPGRFVDADEWRRANPGERHIARIKAVHDLLAPRLVVSHASAAALHGLPWPGEFPVAVEVLDPLRTTGQTLRTVHKRAGAGRRFRTDSMIANGRSLTDRASTVADLAVAYPIRTSVPALDVALAAGTDRADVLAALDAAGSVQFRARAERAIALADGRSGSPGESVARVALDEVGAPEPELQHRFDDVDGLIGVVDFWFPEQGVVLEFDGRVKYTDPSLRRAGQTAADVVVAEKHREDRIRRRPEVHGFGRIGFAETDDTERLRDVLRVLGVPTTRRRFTTVR
ncbi:MULTISPECIES: hypothetical protein [unclassified Curtobacterium]|uniref:hypothetical protein n=1 Tax=unclassified Curtobacterium TaxID=257496 RepID=UPI000A4A6925|nr:MULTISPECIES: hypothetical protein [unclassified Curtobacterium]WIA99040.1 hypothetical protein QOL15_10855 [Curtobacterium sp. MCBA15_012]